MPREVILHIGLHKTATRYLQRALFRHLDQSKFLYNPEPFTELLHQHMRHLEDKALTARFEQAAASFADDPRTLLISLPDISGDMFNSHDNYRANLDVVYTLFPKAKVLYFVRNQADWLVSAYRQSMQKGACGPIEIFLNFRDGAFHAKTARRAGSMRTIDAYGLRFFEIYQAYAQRYGADRVYLVRYEDFQRNRSQVEQMLAQMLQVDALPLTRADSKPNRSFSALALSLFCGGFWMRIWPPKPTDKMPPQWWRKYGPVRVLRVLRRTFIRKIFDRIWYVDWDMLGKNKMRELIDAHYAQENVNIRQAARCVAQDK